LGGLRYAGVGGVPRELFNRDTNNFMPRIGFAYSLNDATVIRGGYGVYFGPMGMRRGPDAIQTNFSQRTNLVPTQDNGLTFIASLADPYPDGVLAPYRSSLGADTYLGQSLNNGYFTPDTQATRTHKWQLGVQRTLPHQFRIELGYIGSRGDHLQMTRDTNAMPIKYLSTLPLRDQTTINYWTGNVPNPFKGLVPGTSMNGSTISRESLIRRFPQFTQTSDWTNEGFNLYNAMHLSVERRFSKGFTVQMGYTWSKLLNANAFLNSFDPEPVYQIAGNDYPHHISLSYIYELPFGRGRPLLSQGHPVVNAILGGWQISGIWTVQSGGPLQFGDSIYYGTDLSEIVLSSDERSWYQWFDTTNFEKASSKQLQYHLRTMPQYFSSIRGPRLNYWDMSALKNTRINEKFSFQYRFEAINAFNQVWLANPTSNNPASTSFGQISSESSVPRRIQMSLKLIF